MSAIAEVAKGLVAPVANIFTKRTERKMARETLAAKNSLARIEGKREVEMTDAEWEVQSIDAQEKTWKDEWVTILMTSPMLLIIIGSVYGAFSEDYRLLKGVQLALSELTKAGVPMGQLMLAVVLAAVGLKIWRNV